MNKKINIIDSKNNSGYIFQDCNMNIIHYDNFNIEWDKISINRSSIWKNYISVIDRSRICKKIDKIMEENDNLFISSVGGLGKTELVKQYLSIYKNKYSSIIWLTYKDNLKTTLLNSLDIKIGQVIDENICYQIVLNSIKKLNSDNIIIFDNMDSVGSEDLQEILSWSSKKILTTRLKVSYLQGHNNIKIYYLESMTDEESKRLFEYYSHVEIDTDSLDFILQKTQKHTLAIKMLAKTLYCSNLSLQQFIDEIHETGFDLSNISETVIDDYGKEDKRFIDHMIKLYDLSESNANFSDSEKILLKNIAILPYQNINLVKIKLYLNLDNYKDIYRLYEIGWIEIYSDDDKYLSLHPVLAEIIRKKLDISFSDCKDMVTYLGEFEMESLKKIRQFRDDYLNDAIAVSEFFLKENRYDAAVFIAAIRNIAFSYYNLLYSEYSKAIFWFKICVDLSKKRKVSILEKIKCNYDLGNAYEDYGDYKQSVYYLKKALYISCLEVQNIEKAKIYISLGVSYSRLRNKSLNSVLKYYNKAEKLFKKNLGNECYEIALLESNKGALFREHNQFDEAVRHHENAIKRMRELVNNNLDLYPRLALMYNTFGNTLLDLYDKSNNINDLYYSLECFNNAKDIQDTYTEEGNPDIAKTYLSLAKCFEYLKDFNMAQSYYIEAYKINHKLLQFFHPLYKANIDGLRRVYVKNGLPINRFNVWLQRQL